MCHGGDTIVEIDMRVNMYFRHAGKPISFRPRGELSALQGRNRFLQFSGSGTAPSIVLNWPQYDHSMGRVQYNELIKPLRHTQRM